WLAANAGLEGAVVVERIKNEKSNIGYNVAEGRYEDMLKAGVIDATKVTRLALQNAASVASLLLTTEALVVEKREKKKAAAPAPGPGTYGLDPGRTRNPLAPDQTAGPHRLAPPVPHILRRRHRHRHRTLLLTPRRTCRRPGARVLPPPVFPDAPAPCLLPPA